MIPASSSAHVCVTGVGSASTSASATASVFAPVLAPVFDSDSALAPATALASFPNPASEVCATVVNSMEAEIANRWAEEEAQMDEEQAADALTEAGAEASSEHEVVANPGAKAAGEEEA